MTLEKNDSCRLQIKPGSLQFYARRTTTTVTVGCELRGKNVVYIINVPGLRFCRNVGEVSARIVYTLAFKAPSTANDMDYKHFKKHCVFSEDRHFISSKCGIDMWRNRGATCVPKNADGQTAFCLYIPYSGNVWWG